jgi:hypothetical protein
MSLLGLREAATMIIGSEVNVPFGKGLTVIFSSQLAASRIRKNTATQIAVIVVTLTLGVWSAQAEEAWVKVEPDNARFTASFPKEPELKTQTVNGLSNYVYMLELPDHIYGVSYFDTRANFRLTTDVAMKAFATARKATVLEEKKVTVGKFQGREATMQLTGDREVRLLLVPVGRRQFQIILEGAKSIVHSADSDKFFASFQPH